jgi:hypothetical protein
VVLPAPAALDAVGELAHKATGLADHALGNRHQPAVALKHPLPTLVSAAARSAADLDETSARTAGAIPKRGPRDDGQFGNSLHRPSENPNPVPEQRRIGRVVDIRLDDRRVHSHLAPADDPALLSDCHDPLVDLLDDLWADGDAELAQRLGIGHLGGTDPCELAIHEVGADFALEHRVAPVADVLENQQTDRNVNGRSLASTGAAVCPSQRQGCVGHVEQQRIVEHAVDVAHPVFPEIANLLGDEAVAEVELTTTQLDHVTPCRVPWPVGPSSTA